MMTGARGEAVIEAGDREVPVLMTNRAIAVAEEQTGKSILEILEGYYADGKSGMRELAYLLRAGMESARRDARIGGRPVSLPQAYEVLDEVGFAKVAEAVMMAVAAVLSYGTEAEDEVPNA